MEDVCVLETKEHQFYHQAQNCHGFLGKDNTRCPPIVPLPEKSKGSKLSE